jgi:DNA-binding XRE family transcriptional regulator
MEIRTRLKELRRNKRMSYRTLGELTGIHWTTLSYIEKGHRWYTMSLLVFARRMA